MKRKIQVVACGKTLRYLERHPEQLRALVEAVEQFLKKVDSGQARSVETYTRIMRALGRG